MWVDSTATSIVKGERKMGLERFSPPYSIHVGCNTTKIDGFVNVDARPTSATDLVHDCKDLSAFPDSSAKLVFAHAFLEHLYRDQRVPFLTEARRVLQADGLLFLMGIPDFEAVARCYLGQAEGNVSPRFDLFEVYRYTHGHPEHQAAWWQEQLHKSLFDQHELRDMLAQAGFHAPAILRYAYRNEKNAVSLGVVARGSNTSVSSDTVAGVYRMFAAIYGNNEFVLLT
jgi:predicted SAM-dependent methyltransferase